MKYLLILLLSFSPINALEIDKEKSAFMIVTHKGGLISGLAHNHIVHANKFNGVVDISKEAIEKGTAQITIAVKDLINDDLKFSKKWISNLVTLNILENTPSEISKGNREGIKETMLGDTQLDAENFPVISGKLVSIKKLKNEPYTHQGKFEITIKSKTITKLCPIIIKWENNKMNSESVCYLKFTDFGIEPISIMFGAVTNKNEFYLYTKIVSK